MAGGRRLFWGDEGLVCASEWSVPAAVPGGSSVLKHLAVLPIPGFVLAIGVAAVLVARGICEPYWLPPAINTIFLCSRGGRRRQPIFDSPGGPNCPRSSC